MIARASADGQSPQSESVPWQRGPARPRLAPGEVHVWLAHVSRLDGLRGLLSADERKREQRLVSEDDRRLWSSSRGALRELLARYLETNASGIALLVEANGKPRVRAASGAREDPAAADELHFNLSHSGELALYAFASDWPVGVDVQVALDDQRRGARDHVALARRVFGQHEADRLAGLELSQRERELLRLWTTYEAEQKRTGQGIGGSTAHVKAHSWVAELDVGAGAAAAVAGERPASALRLWSFA
jgi:4'-phosphopantetheinyl transferase